MRISYQQKYDLSKPAVVKLWFDERYLVLKLSDIKEDLSALKEAWINDTYPGGDLKIYNTIRVRKAVRALHPKKGKCVVEIVLSSNKGEELLAKEQLVLNQRDKQCLNSNKDAFFSRWLFGFITPKESIGGYFRLKGRHAAVPCIVKLWVGNKFFIWKCMDIQEFEWKFNESMAKNIQRYDPRSKDLMNPLVKYILDSQIEHGTIEVVYKANPKTRGWLKAYLAYEKKLLDKHARKAGCLNVSVKQYIPKWIKELTINPLQNVK